MKVLRLFCAQLEAVLALARSGAWARPVAAAAALLVAGRAEAAITQPTAWTQRYASTTYPNGVVGSAINIAPGTNRILLVAIASNRTSSGTQTVSVSYGGQALTLAQGDGGTSAQPHTYLYYLLDAGIQAATNQNLSVSITSAGTAVYTWVYAAVFAGVDQTTPFTDSRTVTQQSTSSTAVGPFNPALSLGANDWPIEIVHLQRSSINNTARDISTWAPGWGTTGGATTPVDASNTSSFTSHIYIAHRVIPAASTTDPSQHTASSQNTYSSMTGFSLKESVASILIGNGTDPGNPSISLGQTAALDAFTVQASSGTATIDAVTVDIPSSAAALSNVFVNGASDCGGTTYGSLGAAPADGGNTIPLTTGIGATTTSGGTSYYVCVTAAAVGASTDVTGTVSAVSAAGYGSVDEDLTGATVTVTPRIDIGNGTDPGSSTITAGQTAAMDAFTLGTTGGTATVTAVTVNVAGAASALADLSVNDAPGCDGTTWGSLGAAPLAGDNTISISTGIDVTTSTSPSFYVCATAAVVGAAADVTGTVSAVTAAGFAFLDGDTSGATVTVGVPPSLTVGEGSDPAPASISKDGTAALDAFTLQTSSGTATVTAVTVNVPSNAAALSNLSIRSLASCGGGSYGALGGPPADGDNTIPLGVGLLATPTSGATSYYVCATAAAVGVDTPVTGNVASVVAVGFAPVDADASGPTITVTPAPDVIVGDAASEPSNASIGFGGVAALDAFTLGVASGTAQVTSVSVSLTNGAALFSVSIHGDPSCAGTRYGYLEGPAGGENAIQLGTALDVGTATATYYVCVTGGSVASSTPVTGTVASVTALGHGSVDGDAQSATITVQPTVPAGSTSTAAPMVSIVNPADGAVVSSATSYKVQIRVFNSTAQGGVAGLLGSVALSTDGGATFPRTATRNAAYDSGTTAATYEVTVPNPATGTYVLRARASNGAVTNVLSEPIVVRSIGARGDGKLLLRDNANQLCSDCHAIQGHSSESVGMKYGSWAAACRDCHAAHGTRNVKLVKESIRPPSVNGGQLPRNVGFVTATGDSGAAGWDAAGGKPTGTASFANADGSGPCQVCHTRTQGPGAVARWRNTGNADTHYTAGAGTQACTDCHLHAKGFGGGESEGGGNCSGCHRSTWESATGAQAGIVARHTLGSVRGTNDSFADSGLAWSTVTSLSDNAPSQRSCVNMCHQDHVHNQPPSGTTHDHNVHADAGTGATRAVTRGSGGTITGGTPARTDFTPGAAPNGLCVSCHQKPVAAGRAAVAGAAFDASAHEYVSNTVGTSTYDWRYTLHDGSTFDRNCTKCHASRAEGTTPASGGTITAVHGTSDPTLLAGARNPAGTPAGFVCYNCHGSAATPAPGQQGNRSGKDIQTQVAKASNHPANADAVHSGAELSAASFGNALGGVERHASCMDCHDPHGARAGTHAVTTNVAGPPLEGAWGAALTTPPAFWTSPTAGSFTKKTIVAGSDAEATLCFKCHSSFYGALPTSPSGGYTETDTAREFNPNNAGNWYTTGTLTSWTTGETAGGFHPVLADAGNNLGRINMANLVTTNFAWRTTGARNLMTCTDCHESNGVADPNGPHGSTAGFILRGPNTLWNATLAASSSSMPAGTFCTNCHSSTWSGSRFATNQHTNRSDHRVSCWNCHARIPHGGPRPGILVASAGAGTGVGGVIAGWDQTAPYWGLGTSSSKLYIASYPSSPTGQWSQNNCGCNGTGH